MARMPSSERSNPKQAWPRWQKAARFSSAKSARNAAGRLQAKLFTPHRKTNSSAQSARRNDFPLRALDLIAIVKAGPWCVLLANGNLRDGPILQACSAVRIEVAPLRNRKADVPLLASHFIESYADRRRSFPIISDAAMECLLAYSWPGNVLELERAVRWALSFASSPVIELDDLHAERSRSGMSWQVPRPRRQALYSAERDYLAIIKALDATGGDRTAGRESPADARIDAAQQASSLWLITYNSMEAGNW